MFGNVVGFKDLGLRLRRGELGEAGRVPNTTRTGQNIIINTIVIVHVITGN